MLPYRKKRRIKLLIWAGCIILFLVFTFLKIERDIKPLLFSITQSELQIITTDIINKTVKEELSRDIKYSDFVNIKTDKNGEISAIELNTIEMNRFGNNVSVRVMEEIKAVGGRGVRIPAGVITGSVLLANSGPDMNIKVLPTGGVYTDFKSELESAGINQTRYRVFITVNTNMQILIPFGSEKISIVSTIPVAETLIVGKVPGSYFNTTPGSVISPSIVPMPQIKNK